MWVENWRHYGFSTIFAFWCCLKYSFGSGSLLLDCVNQLFKTLMKAVWLSLSFVKYRKIPCPLAVVVCLFLNRPEPDFPDDILLSFSIHKYFRFRFINNVKYYLSSIWKSPDRKRQKKSEQESSFPFSFIVDDRYALFLTPNAYSDVLMRIFTPYLFFQCVLTNFNA